jgi:hypothetical protein
MTAAGQFAAPLLWTLLWKLKGQDRGRPEGPGYRAKSLLNNL